MAHTHTHTHTHQSNDQKVVAHPLLDWGAYSLVAMPFEGDILTFNFQYLTNCFFIFIGGGRYHYMYTILTMNIVYVYTMRIYHINGYMLPDIYVSLCVTHQ